MNVSTAGYQERIASMQRQEDGCLAMVLGLPQRIKTALTLLFSAGLLWLTTSPDTVAAEETTSLGQAIERIEQLEEQMNQLRAERPTARDVTPAVDADIEPSVEIPSSPTQTTHAGLPVTSTALRYGQNVPCDDVLACGRPMCDYVVADRWFSSTEFLYLKPHQRGLDFAVTEDGTAFSLGEGTVHNLDYDRDVGLRTSVGYRTKTDWSIRFVYTTLETDGVAEAIRPEGIGQLFATRSQPGGAEEADEAHAFSSFSYQVFDLQLERPIYQNRFALLNVVGGLRWLDVRQRFQYDYFGRDFTEGLISDVTNVEGLGLRLGGEFQWQFAAGFSLFGGAAAGMVLGEFESRYYESNLSDTIVISHFRDDHEAAIASLDAQLGVARRIADWLTVSAGYEMAQWFNLSDRAMVTDDIQEATFAPLTQDIVLEGLFVRTNVVW